MVRELNSREGGIHLEIPFLAFVSRERRATRQVPVLIPEWLVKAESTERRKVVNTFRRFTEIGIVG